jgi:hypothetical protein
MVCLPMPSQLLLIGHALGAKHGNGVRAIAVYLSCGMWGCPWAVLRSGITG